MEKIDDNFQADAIDILNREILRIRKISDAQGLSSDDAEILKKLIDSYVRISSMPKKNPKAKERAITFKRVTDGSLVEQLKNKTNKRKIKSPDEDE